MRQRGLILMLAGMFAAVIAAVLVFSLSSSKIAPVTIVAATVTPFPTQLAVIAARDIGIREVVAAADVVTREFPTGLLPADAVKSVADVMSKTATSKLFLGQVILDRQFIAAAERTGLSTIITPGKVLVAFPASGILNSVGAVRAGDHVDIQLSLPVSGTTTLNSSDAPEQQALGAKFLVTQQTIQNVEVYSIGAFTAEGDEGNTTNAPGAGTMTFVLDHQEALILKYIKDSGGIIDLVVRSINERNAVNTDPVSLDYLVDLYHFAELPR
ncbi:MAG TPA: Flp pilus assembly protein CpaB [Chloroflexia bacterium]|nr:Flp pilus assembly protein CpaB [Chloroflexia bacterium]